MLFSWTSLGGRGRHKAIWVGGALPCARRSVTGLRSGLLCPSPTVAVSAVGHPRNSWVFLVGEIKEALPSLSLNTLDNEGEEYLRKLADCVLFLYFHPQLWCLYRKTSKLFPRKNHLIWFNFLKIDLLFIHSLTHSFQFY